MLAQMQLRDSTVEVWSDKPRAQQAAMGIVLGEPFAEPFHRSVALRRGRSGERASVPEMEEFVRQLVAPIDEGLTGLPVRRCDGGAVCECFGVRIAGQQRDQVPAGGRTAE